MEILRDFYPNEIISYEDTEHGRRQHGLGIKQKRIKLTSAEVIMLMVNKNKRMRS